MSNLVKPTSISPSFVALGTFLKECPYIITLGVRPQFKDYTLEEQNLIKKSPIIFFPTSKYVSVFQGAGKSTFPSPYSYYFRKRRFLQWTLASYLDIPRLKTKCYAKDTQAKVILKDFSLPLKILNVINDRLPGMVVENEGDLEATLKSTPHLILIQEVPGKVIAEISLVFIFYRLSGLKRTPDDIAFPFSIIELSTDIVIKANLDYIAITWSLTEGGWVFSGMDFPPKNFYSTDNEPVNRRTVLCKYVREIAIESVRERL